MYSLEKEASMQNFGLSSGLSNIVITSLLKDKVDELTLNRVRDPVNIKFYNVGESGESSEQGIADIFASFGLPFLTAFLLFFSIFSSSGFLLRGVAEEKENRIIEILLSSATPFEILTGKIFGLGAVGLMQVVIWLAAITLGSGYALPIKIEPITLFLALIYFMKININ